jgi:hypothetical protein
MFISAAKVLHSKMAPLRTTSHLTRLVGRVSARPAPRAGLSCQVETVTGYIVPESSLGETLGGAEFRPAAAIVFSDIGQIEVQRAAWHFVRRVSKGGTDLRAFSGLARCLFRQI